MGLKAQKRREFFRKHPICCFCGGDAQATEPDHIPSRVLFDNRQWPEGYVFPSCVACNRETRHDEQVVALLSRIYPEADTLEKEKELNERIRAVAFNYPEIIPELMPTLNQKRKAIKKYNIEIPEGMASADLPALSFEGPLVNKAVTNFGRKLFLALYYKHTKDILTNESGIAILWFSNLQIENDELPQNIATIVSNIPTLERCKTNLSDQFFYKYTITETKNLSVFIAFFRQSFAILGFINQDYLNFELPEGSVILRPFKHNVIN